MLEYASMTRLPAIVLVIAAAQTSVASAGAYVGLGVGTAVGGSWQAPERGNEGDVDGFERSGRLVVGTRISKLSLEGQVGRFALTFGDPLEYQGTQLGVGLKYSIPLGNNFEVFPKAGVGRTWLSGMSSPDESYAGNGWFLGAGVEYRLNLGVTAASLFLDYQRSSTDFDSVPMYAFDSSIGMWTLGATVSL